MKVCAWLQILAALPLFAEPPGASVQVKVQVPAAYATGVFAQRQFLMVPPGFQIAVWARLTGARFLAVAPNGDVFVSQPGSGSVYVFRPVGGAAPQQYRYATGLANPHGMAFDTINGATYLYIAESNQISRFLYNSGDTVSHDRQIIIKGLPDGGLPGFNGSYAHPLKNIAIGPDHLLYVGLGSSCNVCASDAAADPIRGSIYVYQPDGSGGRVFARGLRNAEGLAFLPGTNTLWAAVNNRDQLPYPYQDSTNQYDRVLTSYVDDHPPEPFTAIRDGGNYGWPFCNPTQDGPTGFASMKFDLDLDTNGDGHVSCSAMDVINRGFPAHSAPLQFGFAQGTAFPAIYREGAIVAFHGSWDRSVPTGYKVVYLPWNSRSATPGNEMDLVSGFQKMGARPAGVAITASGSLLISDDALGAIFELTYTPAAVSGASSYPVIAPESFASVYGSSLSDQTVGSGPPYPTSLGGVALSLTDSAGHTFQPVLSYVSPKQINFVVPADIAVGTANLAWESQWFTKDLGTVEVQLTSPALFSVNGTGTGTAAATAVDAAGNSVPVFTCQGSNCQETPINVSGPTKYVSLYGTGIRNAASGSVQVLVNGTQIPVTYAGAQAAFPGMDQINIPLPASLAGSGEVEVQVLVGGVRSNTVTLLIQ